MHTGFIRDVNFDRCSLIRTMDGQLLALLGSGQGTLFVYVCKGYAFGSGFSKGKRSFFTNAACGLEKSSQQDFVMG